jgi:hypothetical protein
MKKALFVALVGFVLAGLASAQGYGAAGVPRVSVSGTVGLANGIITVSDGKTTYFAPALTRYIGFIDGFKEGAQVTVQGFLDPSNTLRPATLTINGASYAIGAAQYEGALGHHGEGGGHHGRRRWW